MLATPTPPAATADAPSTAPAARNTSPSPSSRQGGFLSSFGARITRRFSKGGEDDGRDGEESVGSASPLNGNKKDDRSLSRGREALQSTGRGGFGNIRQTSVSRDRPAGGPDDYSSTRGREREVNVGGGSPGIYSTGRGGAGNLRSPSREPGVHAKEGGEARYEKEVIEQYVAEHGDGAVSTGRGGLGNIARSRSRDPSGVRATSRDPPRSVSRTRGVHTTGRGGAGNVREGAGDGYEGNREDEVERGKHGVHAKELPHSTGRGGIANITEQDEPALERPSIGHREGEWGSTGRGGAGNLVRN